MKKTQCYIKDTMIQHIFLKLQAKTPKNEGLKTNVVEFDKTVPMPLEWVQSESVWYPSYDFLFFFYSVFDPNPSQNKY